MPANPAVSELIQAWVPHDLAARLRVCAEGNDRTLAAEVRQAIRGHINSEAAPGRAAFAQTTRMTVRDDATPE